jgi:hypothetical protein
VQAQVRRPLKDAAAVNADRWALFHRLRVTGLSVEVRTRGRTKWNRSRCELPTAHWSDAACVGNSTPEHVACAGVTPLHSTAMGRNSRQMCRSNACGFPDKAPREPREPRAPRAPKAPKAPKATRVVGGFRTGGIARAAVPAPGRNTGVYVGRLATRATGSCNTKTHQHSAGDPRPLLPIAPVRG